MTSLGLLTEKYTSLSMIGMCKNAGKTTALNHLIADLNDRHETFAVTSVGRDGESTDVVTGTKKPGIYIHEGTLIATAAGLLEWCDITKEILAVTGMNTPMGEVVVIRALSDGNVQLAGPSMNEQIIEISGMFRAFGAQKILIDGAVSRKTLGSARVAEAAVLCTGASYHKDMQTVVDHTAYFCRLLSLQPPKCGRALSAIRAAAGSAKAVLANDQGDVRRIKTAKEMSTALGSREDSGFNYIFVDGALSDGILKPLLMSNISFRDKTVITGDSSKILLSPPVCEKLFVKGAQLAVLDPISLAAVTINPFSAYGYHFDKQEFLDWMSEAVEVPVINVEEGINDSTDV